MSEIALVQVPAKLYRKYYWMWARCGHCGLDRSLAFKKGSHGRRTRLPRVRLGRIYQSMKPKKRHTKRRIIRKITKARLDEFLALVGWSTRHHGASTWRLYNPYGGCSIFQFHHDREKPDEPIYNLCIDEFYEQRPFGKVMKGYEYAHAGFLQFILSGCTLEAHSDDGGETWNFVSIVTKTATHKGASFICFQPWSSVVPKDATCEE